MIFEYCEKAMDKAEYKKLEDGSWFAEIPGFQGVWANGSSVEECRRELISVLEEWLILKLRDADPIPEINGLRSDWKRRRSGALEAAGKFSSGKHDISRKHDDYLSEVFSK